MSYRFDKNDVYALANSIGAEVKEKRGELFFKYCPYCEGGGHDKETFSVNLESGAFNCFRSGCGKKGHFVELARDFGFTLDFGISPKKKYKKLEQKEITVRDEAIAFLASRGISEETARRYKITTRTDDPKILVFPFYDENGVMVSAKYRKTDFDKRRDKNKEWFEAETMPILFGMKQCVNFSSVVVTEGQLDSLSVADCGIKNAVSVPTGANGFTWAAYCYDWLSKFDEIVVFGDCEKGGISLVEGISKRFPSSRIRVVRECDYLGEKDANDILRKYGRDAVRKCVENAEIKPVAAVKQIADVKKVDMNSLPRIETGIYDLDRVIGGLFPGMVTLLTGKRGEGKSTFASNIFANALEQGVNAFAYSGELPDYHFKNWLDLQLAGGEHIETSKNKFGDNTYWLTDETVGAINDWYRDKAYIYDNSAVMEQSADTEETALLEVIRRAVCRYNVRFVLIDNLMTALDADPSSDLYRAQSSFVKNVKLLAQQLDVAVLLVAHPKKESAGTELGNDSVSGSSDITNFVDFVLTYSANTSAESREVYQSLIGVTKNRLDGRLIYGDKRIKLRYSEKSKRIVCDNDNPKKVYGCFKSLVTSERDKPPF